MTLTENRLVWHRQGVVFTSANTTYPVDLVTDPNIDNVDPDATSNTNGVLMPARYANQRVVARVTLSADDAPSAVIAVYGYVRRVKEPNGTFTEMDYTGSSDEEIPWDHIHTLNSGNAITIATDAAGGVNVCQTGAFSLMYNEPFFVGGMYERLRLIPVVLTGTNPRCFIDLAFAGGQR